MRFINLPNLSVPLDCLIGMCPFTSFLTLKAPLVWVFFFLLTLPFLLRPLLMLIGLRAQTLGILSLATVFILAMPLTPVSPRNRRQFLILLLRPNFAVWQLLFVSFNGVLTLLLGFGVSSTVPISLWCDN